MSLVPALTPEILLKQNRQLAEQIKVYREESSRCEIDYYLILIVCGRSRDSVLSHDFTRTQSSAAEATARMVAAVEESNVVKSIMCEIIEELKDVLGIRQHHTDEEMEEEMSEVGNFASLRLAIITVLFHCLLSLL